jgi:hypothetical protein
MRNGVHDIYREKHNLIALIMVGLISSIGGDHRSGSIECGLALAPAESPNWPATEIELDAIINPLNGILEGKIMLNQ